MSEIDFVAIGEVDVTEFLQQHCPKVWVELESRCTEEEESERGEPAGREWDE